MRTTARYATDGRSPGAKTPIVSFAAIGLKNRLKLKRKRTNNSRRWIVKDDLLDEFLLISKEALTCLSSGRRDEDLIYRLRDTIRKAEGNLGRDELLLHRSSDELHRVGVRQHP